jgi:CubicO group peptidase (beta-lactamase class C family)
VWPINPDPITHVRVTAILLLMLIANSTLAVDEGQSRKPGALDARWQELSDRIERVRQSENVPVLALTVFDQHQPVLVVVNGDASVTTPLRWGSITKTFTALALMTLAQQKNVDLQTPVHTILPDVPWQNPWQETHPVRFIHLLELTAGFTDLTRTEFSDNTPRALFAQLERPTKSRSLYWPPGFQFSYSNVAPGMTAWVVQRWSGLSFEAYLARHVLAPLGMQAASLQPVDDLAPGYRADGVTPIPYWHMTYRAFGGLNASLAEMNKAITILLNSQKHGGRTLFAPSIIGHLYTPDSGLAAEAGLPIGYASGIYGRVRRGFVWYGHGGDADGYRSRYALLPEHGRGYILLINTDNPRLLRRMERIIEAKLVEDLTKPIPPPRRSLDTATLAAYTGRYYPSASRLGADAWLAGRSREINIDLADGELTYRSTARQAALIPVTRNQFREHDDPVATSVFMEQDGEMYLQGELGNYIRVRPGECPTWRADCAWD